MKNAVINFWKNYFNFRGKASRSEYWWNALLNVVIIPILYLLLVIFDSNMIALSLCWVIQFYYLISFIPGLAIQCRRYRDTDTKICWFIGYIIAKVALLISIFLCFVPSMDSWIMGMSMPGYHASTIFHLTESTTIGLVITVFLYVVVRIANLIILIKPSKY